MPSAVVSLRVSEEQAERLQRKARQLGRSPSETGAILLDESLRRDEFAFIDFRDSPVGRQAYIQGSRLAVWQVVTLARSYSGDVKKTAEHLAWPLVKVQSALSYAKAYGPIAWCICADETKDPTGERVDPSKDLTKAMKCRVEAGLTPMERD